MKSLQREALAFKDYDRYWNTIHAIKPGPTKAKAKPINIKEVTLGKVFGKLVITDPEPVINKRHLSFQVKCFCGAPKKLVRWESLKSGNTKSCGCTKGRNKPRGKGWGSC